MTNDAGSADYGPREFTDELTWGEILGPAMKIAQDGNEEAAEKYLNGYIAYLARRNEWPDAEARRVALSNIGYYAGYYNSETMKAVGRVFGAAHPIFGGDTSPSPEKAFEAGKRAALGEFE